MKAKGSNLLATIESIFEKYIIPIKGGLPNYYFEGSENGLWLNICSSALDPGLLQELLTLKPYSVKIDTDQCDALQLRFTL